MIEVKESFVDWVEDRSYLNLTLSWNIIYGSGTIRQKIFKSSHYYVAVGNLDTEEVQVKLIFQIRALLYNTSQAKYKCSLVHRVCSYKLSFLGTSTSVLTSSGREKGTSDDWHVQLSYEPRWIFYISGSGALTLLVLLALKLCNKFQSTSRPGVGFEAGEVGSERTPLLVQKTDDASSLGSSYESVSHDEDEFGDLFAVGFQEAKSVNEGGSNHHGGLCVICFDAPKDCFFLPCGHCAACFPCGTRIVEDAGTCPICRRKMKKVRKIFSV